MTFKQGAITLWQMSKSSLFLLCVFFSFFSLSSEGKAGQAAPPKQVFEAIRERVSDLQEKKAIALTPPDQETAVVDQYAGRDIILHIPKTLLAKTLHPMVVVLHGGMGNAGHIQQILDIDKSADTHGFIVAYLNGSPALAGGDTRFHAWNAGGGCCGQPFKRGVDDVLYITQAIRYLVERYPIDSSHIFGMGHSNGAIMTQRVMCETDLYQGAISIAGPLMLDHPSCPLAKGKRILALHGALDKNVPILGGKGSKGLTSLSYRSQEETKQIFERFGADYSLEILTGTDHSLSHIAEAILTREHITLGEKSARFFGLTEDRKQL